MPVYSLACRKPLADETRRAVAQAITQAHCRVTAAPARFVNVVFLDHYALPSGVEISAVGGVRKGGNRTAETIERLRLALVQAIVGAAQKSEGQVVVNLVGVPASWVMEGGQVMPEPGAEAASA